MLLQAVYKAVTRNELWCSQQCLNLLAPEVSTSPLIRKLLSEFQTLHYCFQN